MLKIGLKIEADNENITVKLVDPAKKELDSATEQERYIAQIFKNLFNKKLMELLQEEIDNRI